MPEPMSEQERINQQMQHLRESQSVFASEIPAANREQFIANVRERLRQMNVPEKDLTPEILQKYLVSYFRYNNMAPDFDIFQESNVENVAQMIYALMYPGV